MICLGARLRCGQWSARFHWTVLMGRFPDTLPGLWHGNCFGFACGLPDRRLPRNSAFRGSFFEDVP